jgi:hypothetical protein
VSVTATIDNKRAALVLKALYIAARNSRNVFHIRQDEMVREIPNYAHQYLSEHPESNSNAAPSFETGQLQDNFQQECHPKEALAFAKRKPANEGSRYWGPHVSIELTTSQ